MKHLFIINPTAGRGTGIEALQDKIVSVCRALSLDYAVEITMQPRHAEAIVRKWASLVRSLRAYACGGDGTLNEVVCGSGANVQVAHFPCGTGNDFVRMFGPGTPLFSDLSALVQGHAVPLDTIHAHDRTALNVFSLGFDARVSMEMRRFKPLARLGSQVPYNFAVASSMLRGMSWAYEIEIDGKDYSGAYTLIALMNGRYYGGGFNPSPSALPNDGLLHIILARRVGPLGLARMIGPYAKGRADTLSVCRCLIGKEMRYRTKRPRAVNFDGEGALSAHGRVALRPAGVQFVLPQGVSLDMLRSAQESVTPLSLEE